MLATCPVLCLRLATVVVVVFENRAKVSDCIQLNYVPLSCDRTELKIGLQSANNNNNKAKASKLSTGQASYRAATPPPPLPPAAVVVGVGDAHMPQARQWVAHACHAAWIAPAIERVVGTSHLFVACLVNAQSKISIRLSRSHSLCICPSSRPSSRLTDLQPHSWPAAVVVAPSWPRPILVIEAFGLLGVD